MDIGEVLSRAWKIIWKHKILWVFGILASCGQGGGGGGGGGGSSNTGVQYSQGEGNIPPGIERFFFDVERFFNQIEVWQIVAIVAVIVLIVLIMWFIALILSTIGRIGLIQGTALADEDEEAERFTFRQLFDSGKPFFWRVLGLNVLIGLVIFVTVMLLILPMIGITVLTFGIGMLCMLPLICLLIPVSWAISIILQQANSALILEDLDIITAIKRGWEVFRNNLGNILVMALILGIGGTIISVIMALPIFLIVIPAALGVILGGMTESQLALDSGLVMAGLCLVGYIPVSIVLGGILRAYIQSSWTLTYMRLTQGLALLDDDADIDLIPEKSVDPPTDDDSSEA